MCKYFSQVKLSLNHLAFSVLQNLLFCVPKAAVLHGKSVGFAAQNSYHFLRELSLQNETKKAHCFIRELAKRISTGLLA